MPLESDPDVVHLRVGDRDHAARLRVHPGDDPVSQSIRATGAWEPFETAVMLGLLRAGDTVVDVGANLGYYTVLAAQAVGPGGRVIALEPDAENLALLRENVTLNGLTNVTVHGAAAADRIGTAVLHRDTVNRGDHRLYPSHNEPRPAETVATTTLDALLPDAVRVRLIKIDAQGSELAIFHGMAGLLASRDPALRIITEVWPYGLREAGGSHEALLALIERHGFAMQSIDEAAQRLEPVTCRALLERLASPWYAEQRGFVNVLLESSVSR